MRILTKLVTAKMKERETELTGACDQWDLESEGEGGSNVILSIYGEMP